MKLLILNNSILAAGDITETAIEIHTADAIYPKHVIAGYSIVDYAGTFEHPLNWYSYVDGTVTLTPPVAPVPTLEELKTARQAEVEAITVTTQSGKTLDGDETSQTRMARAILALQATNTPNIVWVLADNTPALVTVGELVEALALAGAKQAEIWVRPYQ